jgi:hypothetical protein
MVLRHRARGEGEGRLLVSKLIADPAEYFGLAGIDQRVDAG